MGGGHRNGRATVAPGRSYGEESMVSELAERAPSMG